MSIKTIAMMAGVTLTVLFIVNKLSVNPGIVKSIFKG